MKKIISILLITVLLLGAVCVPVNAAQGGAIGDDLSWELSTVGRLTISGTGDTIPDYSAASGAPWAQDASKVKTLSLPRKLILARPKRLVPAVSECAGLKRWNCLIH